MKTQELASDDATLGAVVVDSLSGSAKKVDLEEAIRERWHLHPRAQLQEIAAMLELDGIQVPRRLIERLRQETESRSQSGG